MIELWDKLKLSQKRKSYYVIEHTAKRASRLLNQCSFRNWDGYDANPITLDSVAVLMYFVSIVLPTVPELNGDPDGSVTAYWSDGENLIYI